MLLKTVQDHFKMVASKARAKAKLDKLESDAAEEDKKDEIDEKKDVNEEDKKEEGGTKKLRRREIHWEQPYYFR
jgi:hypothetical protein